MKWVREYAESLPAMDWYLGAGGGGRGFIDPYPLGRTETGCKLWPTEAHGLEVN